MRKDVFITIATIIILLIYCLLPNKSDFQKACGYILMLPLIVSLYQLCIRRKIGIKYYLIFSFVGVITILPLSSINDASLFFVKTFSIITGGIISFIINEFFD